MHSLVKLTCVCADHTGVNINLKPADIPLLSEETKANLRYGSKLIMLVWYSGTTLLWLMKFTMFFF